MIQQEKLFKLTIDTREGPLLFQHVCGSEEEFINKLRVQLRETLAHFEMNYPEKAYGNKKDKN